MHITVFIIYPSFFFKKKITYNEALFEYKLMHVLCNISVFINLKP